MRRRAAAVLALAAALAVPPAAAQAAERKPRPSKHLWATVNICDTERHPNAVGVRGSMPGSGFRDETMWMRFHVQYKTADGRWRSTGRAGVSAFVRVGSARFRRREAGRTFRITPPAAGAHRLRGLVTFEWRRNGEVVRRVKRRTTGGHPEARGGDPAGFSAGSCLVKP